MPTRIEGAYVMATLTAQDIAGQLEQAQREAGELGTELARLVGELEQAAEAKEYERAAQLKKQADLVRPRAMLAQNHAQAIRQTLEGLQEHVRQERAVQIEEERQERAREAHAAATASEKTATDESKRLLAQAKEQLEAAQQSLRQALAAEGMAGQFRQDAYQVAVGAGWQESAPYGVAMPNLIQSWIEQKPLLRDVLRGLD
ncbi:hypothetical protein ABZX77_17920 [Streptomyces sp. NPDC004237]|uniref:hypothetical protein n=1 Tax=Streptomyces sp. NPDC004237 TaxID=3154455 RepID=UPI0033A5AB4D